MSQRIELNPVQCREITRLYIEKSLSARKIGQHFGVSHNIIRRLLAFEGILRPRDKYTHDAQSFHSIIRQDQAYWLGFLYADGCITGKTVLTVSLGWQDNSHLEALKKFLKSEHPVARYTNPSSTQDRAMFSLRSKEIYDSLFNLGCVPRKTLGLIFPSVNQVPASLVRHFMRGYFDGDGSIYPWRLTKLKPDGSSKIHESCALNITGHRDFIEGYKEHLPFEANFSVYDAKGKNASYIVVAGRKRLKEIYDFFYQDASIVLTRKYEVFKSLLGL